MREDDLLHNGQAKAAPLLPATQLTIEAIENALGVESGHRTPA
jgi:hypothetical protein